MGTSPYRLPVLNVSSGPGGLMKVEVDGRRLRASTGVLAPLTRTLTLTLTLTPTLTLTLTVP